MNAEMTVTAVPPNRMKWIRLGIIVAVVGAVLLIAWRTGLTAWLTRDNLRALLLDSGWQGLALFTAATCVGLFVHVPGIVFVGAAALVFGPWKGALVAFGAEAIAVCVTFVVVRVIGGKPLAEVKNRWLKKALDHINTRPVLTVIALRTFFQASPPVNYALALSGMRARDYALGSTIGLIAPCFVIAFGIDWIAG